jgi:hypothetical protein
MTNFWLERVATEKAAEYAAEKAAARSERLENAGWVAAFISVYLAGCFLIWLRNSDGGWGALTVDIFWWLGATFVLVAAYIDTQRFALLQKHRNR